MPPWLSHALLSSAKGEGLRGVYGVRWGLYRDNGKEHGNYTVCIHIYVIYIYRVYGLRLGVQGLGFI